MEGERWNANANLCKILDAGAQKPAAPLVEIISGNKVNIRVGNDTKYSRITQVVGGTTFEWIATAANGWHAVVVGSRIGWVSGRYSRVIT